MTDPTPSAQCLEGGNVPPLPAAEDIYRTELPYVWNFLRRLGIRQQGDLEDLAQEVFFKAFRGLHRFDPTRPLRPWLLGIAFRVAADFLALAKHRRETLGEPFDVADESRGPEDLAAAAQDRRRVLAAIQAIGLDRRPVFVMHELNGHTAPEIAEALGLPLNTVYSRLRVARAEFATFLGDTPRGSP